MYDSYQTETEHSKARIVAMLNGIRCLLSEKWCPFIDLLNADKNACIMIQLVLKFKKKKKKKKKNENKSGQNKRRKLIAHWM